MVVRKKQKVKASSVKDQKQEEKNDMNAEGTKTEKFAKNEKEGENNEVKKEDKKPVRLEVISDERERLKRLEIAGTGVISDARVFQLMYLEKCAVEASLQTQVRKNAYEQRIQALKNELRAVVLDWEAKQKRTIKKIANVRREIEEDYGIMMDHWGYDDETGSLQKLPPKEIEQISKQLQMQKEKAEETQKEKEEAVPLNGGKAPGNAPG